MRDGNVEIDSLISRAAEITLDYGVVVYDALFLALAEVTGTVVTADSKHFRFSAARPTPAWHTASPTSAASSLMLSADLERTATVLQPG